MSWIRASPNGVPAALNFQSQDDGAVLLSNGSIAVRTFASTTRLAYGQNTSDGIIKQIIAIYDPDDYGNYDTGIWRPVVDASDNWQFGSPMHLSPHDGKTIFYKGGHPQYVSSVSKFITLFDTDTGLFSNPFPTNGSFSLGDHSSNGGISILDDGRFLDIGSLRSIDTSKSISEWAITDEAALIDPLSSGYPEFEFSWQEAMGLALVGRPLNAVINWGNWNLFIVESGATLLPDGSYTQFNNIGNSGSLFKGLRGDAWDWFTYAAIGRWFPRLPASVISAGSTGGRITKMEGLGRVFNMTFTGSYPTGEFNKFYRGRWVSTVYGDILHSNWAQLSSPAGVSSAGEMGAPIWSPKMQRVVCIGCYGQIWEYDPFSTASPPQAPYVKALCDPQIKKTMDYAFNGASFPSPGFSPCDYIGKTITGSYTGTLDNLFSSGGSILWRREVAQTVFFESLLPGSVYDLVLFDTYGQPVKLTPPLSWITIKPDGPLPELNLEEVQNIDDSLGAQRLYYHTSASVWKLTVPPGSLKSSVKTFSSYGSSFFVGGDVCYGFRSNYATAGQAESVISVLPSGDIAYWGAYSYTDFCQGKDVPIRVYDGTSDTAYWNDLPPVEFAPPWWSRPMNLPGGLLGIISFPYRLTTTRDPALKTNVMFWRYPPQYGIPQAGWRPSITKVSKTQAMPGDTFELSGTTLTGVSVGTFSGDDNGDQFNIPLFWMTNNVDNKVVRCFTHHWSYRGIQPGRASKMQVTIPEDAPAGDYTCRVITNGIDSENTISFRILSLGQDSGSSGNFFGRL